MSIEDLDARLDRVAALGEPIRRALYRFVAGRPGPVTREEAAAGIGVPLHVAKFHLDRLVEDGLLDADYQRPPGRGGPGAGRPAKVYRRALGELTVSVPERHYELAAELLARAVETAERDARAVRAAVDQVAFDAGREIGTAARQRAGRRPGRTALMTAIREALDERGFETRGDDADVTLSNCPFDALATEHTQLVCGMNLSLLRGMLHGAGLD
ncbi:MAG TPA: helix-turn-helix domain-containing protein, partial [Mycobacteriales bacterium]|nr:helix-turn-helix domain-containing protein [Mycobacteriales bacterium]